MPWTVDDVERHKRGLTDTQKRRWVRVANSVLQRCLDGGGSQSACEASAVRQANGVVGNQMQTLVNANREYTVRIVMHQGRRHFVVPVVMMVEGVHSGSNGPVMHWAEDLGAFPGSWNGIPVVIYHPEDENGHYISANLPDVIDAEIVGRVYNTHMDGPRLRADAYLEESRLRAVSPEALAHINQGLPLEVSVGVFSEEEHTEGQWQSETYHAVARNLRPDHLALLPGGVGACSWSDGCGVRTNEKGGTNDVMTKEKESVDKRKHLDALLINADQDYRELVEGMQRKLDRMDNGERIHYLEKMYDDHIIYRVNVRGETQPKFYRQTYSINEEDNIEFTDSPVEVRRQVEFVNMERKRRRTLFNSNKKEVKVMSKEDKNKDTPCCEKEVDALITNESTTYTKDDREWMLSLGEDQVAKLVANASKAKQPDTPPASDAGDESVKPDKELQVNADQVKEIVKGMFSKSEEYINLMPQDMQDQVRAGLRSYAAERDKLIKHILANTKEGTWTEDGLKAMQHDMLTSLAQSVKQPADYSGMGGGEGAEADVTGEEPYTYAEHLPENRQKVKTQEK